MRVARITRSEVEAIREIHEKIFEVQDLYKDLSLEVQTYLAIKFHNDTGRLLNQLYSNFTEMLGVIAEFERR